jgi:hypothetical protein
VEESQNSTAVPAVEHIINLFFDGEITIPQILEYGAIVLATAFSLIYNKYKRKLLLNEKATSKTDVEIEELKAKNQDLTNQVGLLGNIIVCAYLSNNLVDPELKKKLATYADELMTSTSLDPDRLTERLISAAQNLNVKEKLTDITEMIVKEADQRQDQIDLVKDEAGALAAMLISDVAKPEEQQASEVVDSLKLEG